MPQVTLSVPQEKLPMLNDVLNMLGIDSKKIEKGFEKSISSDNRREPNRLNTFFRTHFGWEYFRNELEFE